MLRNDQLIQAIKDKNIENVKALIAQGADVNYQDSEGITPLHHAISTECVEAVKYLLEQNADAAIKNKYGVYPIRINQYCSSEVRKQVEAEFQKRGLPTPAYAVHGTLINLINKLQFSSETRGICNGIAIQGMIDFYDGIKGVERFNKRLEIIEKYSTTSDDSSPDKRFEKNPDKLIEKIDEVKKYKQELYENYIFKIKDEKLNIDALLQQTLDKDKILLDAASLTEDEWEKIISPVITAEFPGLSETDQKELLHYFYRLYVMSSLFHDFNCQEKQREIKKPSFLDKRDIKNLHQKINMQATRFIINKKIDEEFYTALGDEGVILLEIEPMMYAVAVGHRIGHHTEFLEGKEALLAGKYAANISSAFSVIQSAAMEKRGVIKGASLTNFYDNALLKQFFDMLKSELDKQDFKNPLIIGINNYIAKGAPTHAISIAYFGDDQWGFCNSNSPPARIIHSTEFLADLIIDGLQADNENKVTFNTKIFTSIEDAEKLKTCMTKLNQDPDWQTLYQPKEEFKNIEILAARNGDVKSMLAAETKRKTSFMDRHFGRKWHKLVLQCLGWGFLLGGLVALPYTTFFGIIVISLASAIGFGITSLNLAWTVQSIMTTIKDTQVQSLLELEKTINEKQTSPAPQYTHRFIDAVMGSKTRSRTGFRESVTKLSKDIRNQLEIFFSHTDTSPSFGLFFENTPLTLSQKSTPVFPPHVKKIYDELEEKSCKTQEDYTPEEKLSRAISHAFDAFYHESFFSFKNHQTHAVYEKLIDLVDIKKTCEKIIERIKTLDNKVYAGGGTVIHNEGKEFVVSEKAAEIYHGVQLILKEKDKDKQLQLLAEILHRGKEAFSSNKIWHPLRHEDVWKFFGQMNQFLVVGKHVDSAFVLSGTQYRPKAINDKKVTYEKSSRKLYRH